MGIEIERKFLVSNDLWKADADVGTDFKQGYLTSGEGSSVRVRKEGGKANLNIKSAIMGIKRQEYEYPIPADEADELLELFCPQTVSKTRYTVNYAGKLWEIDVFEKDNLGLVIAEIELNTTDEEFERPPWIGEEVSAEVRYYNNELSRHPYSEWGDKIN